MTNRESSCFIQTRRGSQGDFLLVTGGGAPGATGPGYEWWRCNDEPGEPWRRSGPASDLALRGPAIIQDSYGTPGRRQLVARVELESGWALGRFVLQTRSGLGWGTPVVITASKGLPYSGMPVFVQSDRLPGGSYDIYAPLEDGLVQFMCNSPDPAAPWFSFRSLGSLGQIDALSLVESRLSTGRFELMLRQGPNLAVMWRQKNGPPDSWQEPFHLFDNAAGRPAMIQSKFGLNGHLEVLTLDRDGNLLHAWRNNDEPASAKWHGPHEVVTAPAGTSRVKPDDFVALFQSNYGAPGPGTLEAVCSIGGRHYHLTRDAAPPWKWNGPTKIGTDR